MKYILRSTKGIEGCSKHSSITYKFCNIFKDFVIFFLSTRIDGQDNRVFVYGQS